MTQAQQDTWTGRTLGEPTEEQREVLKAFAAEHGRTWKATLRDAWYSGNDPHMADENHEGLLQQVRNQFGPRWLLLFDIEKA